MSLYKKELVSIIIPCFNAEKTMCRCLDSLLAQTFKNIEIIFVNDGSTDGSGDVAKRYKMMFEEAGMSFVYLEQKNTGLGGAINTGLRAFSGEYLCWGDPDDFWLPDSVKIRKEVLDKNQDFGSVSSDAYIFIEKDLNNPVGKASQNAENVEDVHQFYNHLSGKPLYCSGCHMLRSSAFIYANPKKKIFPARHGQNNQLLMPVYYHFKHMFIPEPLYGYVINDQSMSHKKLSRREKKNVVNEYYCSIKHTIMNIKMPAFEKIKYLRVNEVKRLDALIDYYSDVHGVLKAYLYNLFKHILLG